MDKQSASATSSTPVAPQAELAETSVQESAPSQSVRHGFGARRTASNLASIPPPLPTIAASPDSHGSKHLEPPHSASTQNHSRSTSMASNVAQHRMSIAPSLARNSLISQYSPVIEQATEVSVAPSTSGEPGTSLFEQNPYRRASISDLSQQQYPNPPSKPMYKASTVNRNLSVETVRESTNKLESLLNDMKALRTMSISSGHSSVAPTRSLSNASASNYSNAEYDPSETPVPEINEEATVPPALPEKDRTSMPVSSIAPPVVKPSSQDRALENAPIPTVPIVSTLNSTSLPTVSGSGVVSKAGSHSPKLNKELPLPPVHVESVEPAAPQASQPTEEVKTPALSEPSEDFTDLPMPQLPPKSELRHSQDSTSLTSLKLGSDEILATSWQIPVDNGSPSSGEATHVPSKPLAAPESFSLRDPARKVPEPLVLAKSSTADGASTVHKFTTAPSSPEKQILSAPLPTLNYTSDVNFSNLEGLPAPPFAAAPKSETTQDSSNESFLTAKSYDGESDAETPNSWKFSDKTPLSQAAPQTKLDSPFNINFLSSSQSPGSHHTFSAVENTPDTRNSSQNTSPLKFFAGFGAAGAAAGVQDSRFKAQSPVDLGDIRAMQNKPPSPGIFHDGSSSSESEGGGRSTIVEVKQAAPYNRPVLATTNAAPPAVPAHTAGTREVNPKSSARKSYGMATEGTDMENFAPSVWKESRETIKPVSDSRRSSRRVVSTGSTRSGALGTAAALESDRTRHQKQRQSANPHFDSSAAHGFASASNSHHRSSKRVSTSGVPADRKKAVPTGASTQKRPFSQASIQKLLDQNPNAFNLTDLDLPPTERALIEKFVNSLAKLSADITDDEHKRPEGIRRLNNALRAIEGWI